MTEIRKQPEATAPARTADEQPSVTTVRTEYVTARHVPKERDVKAIMKAAIDISEMSGELFFYRWETSSTDKSTGKTKKGFVIGHSVKLTNEAVRLFGNCVIDQRPVVETAGAWIFTTAFVDLETGFQRSRQFRMDKQWPVYGRMDRFRKDDIRFQIGQSKADRNVVLNSLPQIILERMLETAINSVREQIEFKIKSVYGGNIQKAIEELLKGFKLHDINQELIEAKLGLKRDKWDVNTLVMLTGDVKALQRGSETKDTLYSLDETDDPHGGPKSEPDKPGLSTSDMSPGDADKHQGYDPPDKPEPAKDEAGDTLEALLKLPKGELIGRATDELATTFTDTPLEADKFLVQIVEQKRLNDADIGSDKNNKGQLANLIIDLQGIQLKNTGQVQAGF